MLEHKRKEAQVNTKRAFYSYFFCTLKYASSNQNHKGRSLLDSIDAVRIFMDLACRATWKERPGKKLGHGEVLVRDLKGMEPMQKSRALSFLRKLGYIETVRKGVKGKPAIVRFTDKAPIGLDEAPPHGEKWFRVYRSDMLFDLIENHPKALHLLLYLWAKRMVVDGMNWAMFARRTVPGLTEKEARTAKIYLRKNLLIHTISDQKTVLRIFPKRVTNPYKNKTVVRLCKTGVCDDRIYLVGPSKGAQEPQKGPIDITLSKTYNPEKRTPPSIPPRRRSGSFFDSGNEDEEQNTDFPEEESWDADDEESWDEDEDQVPEPPEPVKPEKRWDGDPIANIPALARSSESLRSVVRELYERRIADGATDKLDWKVENWRWENWHSPEADIYVENFLSDTVLPRGSWYIPWFIIQEAKKAGETYKAITEIPGYEFLRDLKFVAEQTDSVPDGHPDYFCGPKKHLEFKANQKYMYDIEVALHVLTQAYRLQSPLLEPYLHLARRRCSRFTESVERAFVMHMELPDTTERRLAPLEKAMAVHQKALDDFRWEWSHLEEEKVLKNG